MYEVNLSEKWRKNADFVKEVEEHSGVDLKACYQCGKCSAGCLMSFRMDVTPNRIIRLLQLGMVDEALEARTPWVCLTCNTCYTRCPRGIDLPKLMDTLRIIAYKKGIIKHVKKETVFHNIFMNSITKHGRTYEVGLLLSLALGGNINLFDELDLYPMATKGKVPYFPHNTSRRNRIKEMAERAKRLEGGH